MTLLITGLLKFIIGLIGLLMTIAFLTLAAFNRNRKGKLQNAGVSFLVTIILILSIWGLEFLMYPTNSKLDKLVLSAYREAPIGAYWLGLYEDHTWQFGNSSREIEYSGTWVISGDTLHLNSLFDTAFYNGQTKNSFLIEKNNLIEIEDNGIHVLEIGINKLSPSKKP